MATGDEQHLCQLQCYLYSRWHLNVYMKENAWWLCKLLPTCHFIALSRTVGIGSTQGEGNGKVKPLQEVDSNLYAAVETFLNTGTESDFRVFLKIICELAGNGFQPLKTAYRQLVLSIAGLAETN